MFSEGMVEFCLLVVFHNHGGQIYSPRRLNVSKNCRLVPPSLVRLKHRVKQKSANRNGHSKENQEQENTAEMQHDEHVKVKTVHRVHFGLIIANILIHLDIDIALFLQYFLFSGCNLTDLRIFEDPTN